MGEGVGRVLVDIRQPGFDHPYGAIGERLADIDVDGHVGELLLDQAKLRDALRPSLALLGIADSVGQGIASGTDNPGTQFEAADVQRVEGDDVAFADLSQDILNRNFAVVQNEWCGGRASDAHFLFFGADGETRESAFNNESGELLAIDFREYDIEVGEIRVGDPHLLAVQDVMLLIGREHRLGTGIHRVRC